VLRTKGRIWSAQKNHPSRKRVAKTTKSMKRMASKKLSMMKLSQGF
jgi:hypothetical protein